MGFPFVLLLSTGRILTPAAILLPQYLHRISVPQKQVPEKSKGELSHANQNGAVNPTGFRQEPKNLFFS